MHRCCFNDPSCKPLHYTTVQQPGVCLICHNERTAKEGTAWLRPCGHGPFCPDCLETGLGLVSTESYYMYRSGALPLASYSYIQRLRDSLDRHKSSLERHKAKIEQKDKDLTRQREIILANGRKAIRAWTENEELQRENKQLKEYDVVARKIIGERDDKLLELKVEIAERKEKNEQAELEIAELMKHKSTLEKALEDVKNKLEVSRSASHVLERGQKRRCEEYAHETSVLKHMLAEEKCKYAKLTKKIEDAISNPVRVPGALEPEPFFPVYHDDYALTNAAADRDAYPASGANCALGDAFVYRGNEVDKN